MRIALLSREFLPETCWGGIGTFYCDLAPTLRDLGHEVEVFTQGLTDSGCVEVEGVRAHRCLPRWYGFGPRRGGALAGMATRHLGLFAWSLAREVAHCFARRHAGAPFDLVESHEHLGIGALIHRDVPHVVRYHTAYHVLVDRGLEPWPRSRLIRTLEGRTMRRAHLRIAPSEFIDRMTREHFPRLPEADLHIPLTCRFAPATPDVLEDKSALIAWVGRLENRKQPLAAVRAFARVAQRFPDWRLEIAGADAPGSDGRSTWEACRELLGPLAGHCEYRGSVDREAVADLYRRASLTLIPSTFESFGLVALEAMSLGCVPVVSTGNALEEVVGDSGLTAPAGDVEALARQLAALMEDRSRRQELAERGLVRCRERFDRTLVLERNLAAFERTAADPQALRRRTRQS